MIPNIFLFLVLLSYERYHSKQIISIPKIIQLCDGIMASGRKAVTHGEGSIHTHTRAHTIHKLRDTHTHTHTVRV